jgi:hypothetical protein
VRACLQAFVIRETLGCLSADVVGELPRQVHAMRQAAAAGDEKGCIHADELWKRHPRSTKVFADTMAAVFTGNEQPVPDPFPAAAQQIKASNAAS